MKRIIVIGLGNFGSIIAERLHKLGHDVIAIDPLPDVIDAFGHRVSRAVVADATKREVLEQVGIQNIYVKVRSDDHARIADALGATESVFPERETALGLASRLTSGRLLQY